MKGLMQFIKTTIIGGLVFLVPIIIIAVILGKAFELMMLVAKPLDAWIPVGSVGGVALVNVLAVLAIALCCFIAGVVARSALAKKIYHSIESALLTGIPGYAAVKGITDSITHGEKAAEGFQPVLVTFDDNAQIGFEIERTSEGIVVVYLPGAPNPWSGSVVYFSENRVDRLDMTVAEAVRYIRQLGRGAARYGDRVRARLAQ